MKGRHVICPPFLPMPQQPLSTTLNPAMTATTMAAGRKENTCDQIIIIG